MYSHRMSLCDAIVLVDQIVRDADRKILVANPLDGDWQAYQAWLAAGNTPNPPSAASPVVVKAALGGTATAPTTGGAGH